MISLVSLARLFATVRVRATLATVSPGVIAAAGDYIVGDVLNDDVATGIYWVVPAAARANGLGGIIEHVLATCSVAAMVPRLRLHVYNVAPTVYQNDNVALLKAIADRDKEVCEPILLDALQTVGSSTYSWASSGEINQGFDCAGGDDDLYFVVETLDAFTNEVAGMTLDFHFTIAQD